MALNINAVKSENGVRAVGNRVLVTDMYFGEQKTKSGLIINDDNGTTRGIYPRWGKVYSKGPLNKDDYEVGHWILIEHGRWTRGLKVELSDQSKIELRMIESESVLAYSEDKPEEVTIGAEYKDGEHATIDPQSFINS